MRLIAFKNEAGKPALGARIGDELVDLTAMGLPASLDELLRQGDLGMTAAKAALARATARRPMVGLAYLPPVLNPAMFWGCFSTRVLVSRTGSSRC